MTTPGKLQLSPTGTGRVVGPAMITHNDPFPCVNGTPGVTGAMQGVLMHTMVGWLHTAIDMFNDPHRQASAHFGIAMDGRIHQWGPLGKGWMAWHAEAANLTWYGIEHEDGGDQHKPLTDAQMAASAQVVELLSRFAGFPLQVTDDPHGRGYGTHVMGGRAWSHDGHTCPGPGPRAGQRKDIIELAKAIRAGAQPGPPPPDPPARRYMTKVTDGTVSMAAFAAPFGIAPAQILHRTAMYYGGESREWAAVAAWVNDVFAGRRDAQANVPGGLHLRVPVIP
jgi:hypothetical protein